MIANQRLTASDGYEVCLFPLEYMNIFQDEYGSYSHQGILAIDFLGWGANGRVFNCPYYAPFSCTCVATASSNGRVWQSNNPVHLADGTLDYACIDVAHDDNPPSLGDTRVQGDILGHTGVAGHATGDHVHMNFSKGTYDGWDSTQGDRQLKNSIHIYDATFVDNTVIINGAYHDWKSWSNVIPFTRNSKFPWVLYSRKLREKNKLNHKN